MYLVFIGSGLGVASWAARIPQVREELKPTPAAFGIVALAVRPPLPAAARRPSAIRAPPACSAREPGRRRGRWGT